MIVRRSIRKNKKNCLNCEIVIKSTRNNTLLYAYDYTNNYNTIAWSTAGSVGFSGAKRATPHAASEAANDLVNKLKDSGVKNIRFVYKRFGNGRESASRTIINSGHFKIDSFVDKTSVPHGGCRPRKARRV